MQYRIKSFHDFEAFACCIYVMESVFLKMWALPKRTIFCTISTLTCPGIWLMYLLSPFVIKPSAPTATGTVLVSIFHIFATSISRSLYFDIRINLLIRAYWHIPKYCSTFILSNCFWFVIVPIVCSWKVKVL